MQTVEQPPAGRGATPPDTPEVSPSHELFPPLSADGDLQLLLQWPHDPDEAVRTRKAVVGTVAVHLIFIAALVAMPRQTVDRARVPERPLQLTKLFDPPTELTQKAPNKGKISKEITVQSIAPSIPVPTPKPGAQARKFAPPPSAPASAKQAVTAPSLIEPPKIEQSNTAQLQLPQLPQIQPQPQPKPPADTKPKLAFETPSAPHAAPAAQSHIPVPGNSIQDAVRELSRSGAKGISGGDSVDLGGSGAGLNLPPSPGRPRMDYELKSDPLGVDFRPYILQVLATVRRNWFAVYPESAKLGTRGQVKLDFSIAKSGSITKVIFSQQSGAQALDRAAVAAISASNPLPALPADYHGERIILTFTFSYNLPR